MATYRHGGQSSEVAATVKSRARLRSLELVRLRVDDDGSRELTLRLRYADGDELVLGGSLIETLGHAVTVFTGRYLTVTE